MKRLAAKHDQCEGFSMKLSASGRQALKKGMQWTAMTDTKAINLISVAFSALSSPGLALGQKSAKETHRKATESSFSHANTMILHCTSYSVHVHCVSEAPRQPDPWLTEASALTSVAKWLEQWQGLFF